MRKLLLAAAASMALTGVASADPTVNIPLTATLPKQCNVTAFLNGPFDALDPLITTVQGAESLSPICNYGGTLSVTFTSNNAGKLVSGTNEVPYTFYVSGGLASDVSLAAPLVVASWPAVANAVQTRSMSVRLTTPATVAGTYTDIVVASVAPN